MTFVASTGDYGAADPQYPAFSPNVVVVGGTSLTLNADNSYNDETGWGYYSDTAGAFIASGGGLSLYEPEPAYQQEVQSTGSRTTPDVSFAADPATGAWIADPYNLNPSDPFEVVGGTSLSAPAWAGLMALVNQGRAAAGESTLNSTSPTDTQQALYMLPQSDYNVITSGSNGFAAEAGYNLVTGLGTPVANPLVPALIAYQGPGTSYAGPTVAPLQTAGLVNTGANDTGPMDVFSVFDTLTVTSDRLNDAQAQVLSTGVSSPMNVTLAPAGAGQMAGSPVIATGFTSGPALSISPAGLMPLPPSAVAITPVASSFIARQRAWSTAQPVVDAPASSERIVVLQRTDLDIAPVPLATEPPTGLVHRSVLEELALEAGLGRSLALPEKTADAVLDEMASDAAMARGCNAAATFDAPAVPCRPIPDFCSPLSSTLRPCDERQSAAPKVWLTDILFAIGFCGFGASALSASGLRAGKRTRGRGPRFSSPPRRRGADRKGLL